MLKKAVDAALKAERPKEAINVRMLLAQMHTMQVGIVCPEFF
jgi:hypothetical protein